MNRIYRSIWNAALGTWIAAPETSRAAGKRGTTVVVGAVIGVVLALSATHADAACTAAGFNVSCSGAANPLAPSYFNAASNLSVTVNPGGSLGVLLGVGGNAMTLSGSNGTLTNNGRIDPTLLGTGLGVLSSGVVMGNASASTQTVTNNGTMAGTTGLSIGLTGMALAVQNGAGGTTNIINTGTMSTSGIIGATLLGPDAGVIAAYGGGQVNVSNSGTITGRVALGSSAGGNTFTNSGTVNGSVSMGANSTNQFIATTDSSVNSSGGTGLAVNLGIGSVTISFAATGTVDGGAGGNNRLILQQGTSATGTINNGNYVNFNHLDLQSGTWTLSGASGAVDATLGNGATAVVNNAASLGTGAISANGGAIQSTTPGLTLSNNIATSGAGLGVSGSSSLNLSGTVSGTGPVTQSGSGTLTLSGNNTYTGGTNLNAGMIVIGNNQALGTGTLTAGGNATLDSSQAVTVANQVAVNAGASLALGGSNAMTVGGVISGAGGLLKNGAATTTLTGANTYTGGTTINSSTLALGAGGSLAATGAVNLAGAGAGFDISASGANQTIGALAGASGTTISLGANTLTMGDGTNQSFGGSIGGTGGIVKQGSGTEALTGTHTYTGGTTINGGTLALGAGGSLAASGSVNLGTAGAGFDISAAGANQTIGALSGVAGTTVSLGGNTLSFGDATNQTFGGAIGGTGGIVKQGSGTETLTGANTYTGGTTINAGTIAIGAGGSLSNQGTVNLANAGTSLDLSGATTPQAIGGLAGAAGSSVSLGANGLTFGDAGNHTFGGTIGGTGGVTKTGTGTETLTDTQTYTGGTTINGGTLALGAGGSLSAGGAVHLGGTGASFDISGAGAAQTIGALSGVAGTTVALGGNGLTFGDGSNQTFGGAITGTAGIVKQGSGTETLTGTSTFTGGTTINAGTLAIGAGGSLAVGGAVNLANAGTSFDISGATSPQVVGALLGVGGSNINLGSNTLSFGDATNQTFGGAIGGTGGIVKQGSGTETLTGTNTYTGGTTVNAGTIAIGAGGSLSNQGTVNLANAGTSLDLSGATTSQAIGGLAGAAGSSVSLGANGLTFGDAGNHTFGGTIGGTGGVTKTGTGTETLTGTQTYTGGTTINGGTLALGAGGSLAAGGSVNLGTAGASFDITGAGAAQTIGALSGVAGTTVALGGNGLTFGDGSNQTFGGSITGTAGIVKQGSGTQTLTGTSTFSGGTALYAGGLMIGNNAALGSGTVTVNGAATLDSVSAATLANNVALNADLTVLGSNALTLNGDITGTGSLTKDGSATLTLNGTNAYSGGTFIRAGTLALGAGASLYANGVVNLATGATFDLSAGNGTQTFGTLIGNGTVNLGGNSLTVGGPINSVFSGSIGGTGGLIKQGTGTETLTGANTYTGGTSINAGILAIGAGGSLASTGAVNLAAAGTGFDIAAAGNQTVGSLAGVAGSNLFLGGNSLTLGGVGNTNFGGSIDGTGGLIKSGLGVQTLAGANTFSGGTTLNAGGLVVGSNSALGTGLLSVAGSSTLDSTFPVHLSNAIDLGSGVNLQLLGSNDLTLSGDISGAGGLTKGGAATVTLAGSSSYTGDTTINSGAILVGAGGTLSDRSTVNLAGAGSLNIGASGNQNIGGLAGVAGSTLLLGGSNLTTGGNNASTTFSGTISGTGGLLQTGSGTLTLTGNNLYSGSTTINAGGTIQLGNGGSSGAVNGSIVNNGSLIFNRSDAVTVAGSISGNGNITQAGQGTTILTGDNTYQGSTTVGAGTLQVGDGGTGGSLGSGAINNNGTLVFNRSNDLTLNNSINGSGGLTQAGGGTLTLSGSSSYGGSTQVNAGTLNFTNSSHSLGGDLNVAGNASLGVTTGAAVAVSGTVRLANTSTLSLDSTSLAPGLTASSLQIGSGVGLNLSGITSSSQLDRVLISTTNGISGDFALTSVGGFTGEVDYLTLNTRKSVDGKQYLASYSQSWTANNNLAHGTFTLSNLQDQFEVGVALENQASNSALGWDGTSLTKNGAGSLTLSAANSYTGTTRINGGTLQVGNGGSVGNLGLGAVTNNGSLAFNRNDALTVSNDISGSGSLQQNGSGTTTLTGTNTYSGGTTVTAGTLRAGSAGALVQNASYSISQGATLDLNGHTLTSSQIVSNGNIQLGSANLVINSASGQVDSLGGKVSGTGHVVKQGAGVLALNSASDFSGGVDLKQGTLNLGNEKGLGSGTLSMDDGTKINLTANGMTIANNLYMTGDNDPVVDTGANNATWAGAITGAGFLTKQGTGVLTLTNTANTYTGATDVAQGTLQAGAANTFSSTSAHTVASGAVLDLAGFNQTLASLNNSGTVKLSSNSGAVPGAVLKVTGPYVGNNGNLGLSTVLAADGSATDKLLLSGATAVASGNTTVHITNAGGLGAQTTGNGIEVIGTENGASLQPGSFTLVGGHVDAGAYEYRLTQTAQGAALQSTNTTPTTPTTAYRAEVPLLSALPAQLRQADMAMLGDLRKRMGDEGTQATTSSDSGASRRVWGRILRTDPKIRQQGTVSPESSGHLTGFQAGLDLYADQSIKAGIYVGQLEGDMSVKGFASGEDRKYVGFNNLRTRYLGVYGSWQDASGLYADAVLQGADYRSDLRTAGDTAQARTKGSGWLASVEMGKPFAVSSNWQIEPQAQIIYRKLSIDDTALSLATVKNKADDDWTVRLGARIKGNFATGAGVLQPYGRINVYRASNTTDIASFVAPGGTTDIKARGGYTATEMAAGASLQINPRTSVYGELGKLWANGGDSRVKSGVQASIGVKVQW
ncbi:autotransporter-associated beta strand repeat-containing protein [Comamonas testosteroni]|uniref:autotransporter-associated beta strand repeat-containing protein n=1 Tax=Comamonas testosteroni TaxID=285 RepID=UPI0009B6C3B4|nr:autotransporter-associated beta strand repeat-containing protein [Comamonas testosteroni]